MHGFNSSYYRDSYVNRRIEIRMKKSARKTPCEYLNFLKDSREELQELVDCLGVNVTSFFRDKKPFDVMKKLVFPVIAEYAAKNGGNPVKIWSAACATGEEPYSIAISAVESVGLEIKSGLKVQITATDIDEKALLAAAKGEYTFKNMGGMDEKLIKRYFKHIGDKYVVNEKIKNMVAFSKLDIISGIQQDHFDLISCRNMLIYINMGLQKELFEKFHSALNPDGFLIIGKTEVLPFGMHRNFKTIDAGERIYQKIGQEVLWGGLIIKKSAYSWLTMTRGSEKCSARY